MKEMKFEIPADCEVDKIETQDGHIVVTFREKERQLPKSWEEFCEMTGIKIPYNLKQRILDVVGDRAAADAILALCQLIHLRNAYNGDWVPDWDNYSQNKYTIEVNRGEIDANNGDSLSSSPIYFKSEKLRDEFLRCFKSLIEKLKPLYGIKKGGEEC